MLLHVVPRSNVLPWRAIEFVRPANKRSVDPVADGRDGVGVDYLLDLLATVNHHKVTIRGKPRPGPTLAKAGPLSPPCRSTCHSAIS
jgi:hypothetical protein